MDLQQGRSEKIRVNVLLANGAILPKYAHEDDAGLDLYSIETVELKPLERKLISTGVSIELPEHMEAQVRPKSGLAINHGITLLNTPGTIDPGYRGEIKVIAVNLSDSAYTIKEKEKIAQLVFAEFRKAELIPVEKLNETKRGEKGFGSTGLK